MGEERLRTGVLGLNREGKLFIEAAQASSFYKITAVADKDTTLVQQIAAECSCQAFSDYRQFIMQNDLDCLFVAEPIHNCIEHVQMGMRKNWNVLKIPPIARDFEEAAELVGLANEQKNKFAICNPMRFCKSFIDMQKFLLDEKGKVFLVSAFCEVEPESGGWWTDRQLAGGGVLLRNGYGIIDQLITNFGVPQQVYSLNTSSAGDRQQRLYLTEDIAIAAMKFTESCFGNVTVGRFGSHQRHSLTIYSKEKILTVTETSFRISAGCGEIIEEYQNEVSEKQLWITMLEDFAIGVLKPTEKKLTGSASENLLNMAVIQSCYLSAKTGMPEQPEKLLRLAQVDTPRLWALR